MATPPTAFARAAYKLSAPLVPGEMDFFPPWVHFIIPIITPSDRTIVFPDDD